MTTATTDHPFNDQDLAAIVAQVDAALAAESARPPVVYRGAKSPVYDKTDYLATAEQQATLEQATKQPMPSFWRRFREHARRDLCLPGGTLHEQWKKWRELPSRDAVTLTLTFFAGAGLGGVVLAPVVVAAAVVLLNTVSKIGIDTICEGCAEEEAARQRALQAKES